MKTFQFTLKGTSPLLLHADNIDWSDRMKAWGDNPQNKKDSVAGDDRTPAFRWIGCLDHDGTNAGIPAENLMKCLLRAAVQVPIPGNRMRKTFKSEVMSEMVCDAPLFPLAASGKKIDMKKVEKLMGVKEYAAHQTEVATMGFALFAKRARVGTSKHIRVRPKLDAWALSGTVTVWDDKLAKALPEIFEIAGRKIGLGDWNPGGKTPGPYGRFTADIKEVSRRSEAA